MKESKMNLLISFIVLSGLLFYFLNYDFSRIKTAFCNDASGNESEQYGIANYWLEKYDIQISSEYDVSSDSDDDGLTLADEYKYFTNPLVADTDGDGYKDGKEVRDGYNPIGAGKMDIDRDGLPDKWEEDNGLSLTTNDYNLDPDEDGLPNHLELAHLTDPLRSDTDQDGYSDLQEIKNGYDPASGGDSRPDYEITIKKINVNAPVVLSSSQTESDLLEDLKSGVIVYPKTGIPGQSGNTVISGHSSNYVWADGDYNYIFSKANDLVTGDEITVKTTQQNGKSFEYSYTITEKDILKPDDRKIFEETNYPSLTITTCWPLGTNWNRLVIKAKLT